MKLVSWNVNGLRACVNKGFMDYYHQSEADIFCLQETKLQAGQIEMELGEDVYQYWNYAIKKGYSGTAVFSRIKPLSVRYGMEEDSEPEGRMLTLEYDAFYLINVYTPNAKRDLTRLPYRLEWEDRFRSYVLQLEKTKPVIICGDLNVAHQEIDLKNPKPNMGNSGFTDEERGKMTDLLASGYVDSFRHLHPDQTDVYSWWSYMPKVRERNVGWRIDYFLVSQQLASKVTDAYIDCHVMGSDHCPVGVQLQG
ncbi:exodeoxyribonuclease III [Paenibacillus barcinonensis]|uniref:Exodeoxyribonuclease III n=1 Tax=Paenibacillus barcinonensis TaxID=198119 RepID=A0A2V4VKD4_PAEBA|nr:exodeoxyribonuclease III [Paenibacillus barcinonensis]PYE49694.1 exodeoxyribonuclease-3 [Paenibacillus barcinonensis]QKS56602.1 exodeoxyribonuclease III [Paenibacillus barcinonensis]